MSSHFVYGFHAVKSVLHAEDATIRCIYWYAKRQDARIKELLSLAKTRKIVCQASETHEALDQLAGTTTHQGVVAELAEPLHSYQEGDLAALLDKHPQPFLLILDGVTDPQNLGACLRTADAAGVTAVIVPKDRAAKLTPLVRKVASGAAEKVPFIPVTNLVRTLRTLKERAIWIYGTDLTAQQSLYEAELIRPLAFVMGAEGSGLRRLTREACDVLVSLPMQGAVSSLNVSVATGICLYEALRRFN